MAICLLAAGAAAPQSPRAENLLGEPHKLYQALNALHVDPARVYYVHDVNLRRDAVSLTFSEGRLALLAPLGGRVTGAVFTGRGRVIAMPRDPSEKRSLARFLGVPLLDQPFSRAYLRFTDDTAAELQERLREAGTAPANEPGFADSWGSAVANLNPGHSLRVMADWLSADPKPYFYAGLAGSVFGPFDVLVDHRRGEQVLFGQRRSVNGENIYDVWASFPAKDTPAPPLDSLIPLDYAVSTSIAEDRTLKGETTLHLRAVRGGERLIELELSRFLRVEGAIDANGRPLAFFQNEELNRQEIARRGNDLVYVVLPEPAAAGADFRLRLAYGGSVIADAGNGVYYVGARGSWYPHIGGPDHFVMFDLKFRWPRRLTLVATGALFEEREDGNSRIGHWRSQVPQAVAGFNLGEYVTWVVGADHPKIELYANQQLEDAIFTRMQHHPTTIPLPSPRGVFPQLGGRGPEILSEEPPPIPAAVLSQLGAEMLDCIHYFEELNGPFPFEHLEVSQIPGSFGQGWPGLLYLPTAVFLPPEAREPAGISPLTQEQISEIVPFHEEAHQWWGNVVGMASYRDAWVEEAMANYLALLNADRRRPAARVLPSFLERFRAQLLAKKPGAKETAEAAGPLSLGYRLSSSKSPGAYETIIYGKGTWLIHMLRMMLRDAAAKNPDARFTELLRTVLSQYRFRPLSAADFQRAVEAVMTPAMDLEGNHSLDWFFDEWVRGTGIPRYAVEFKVQPDGKGFLVRGTLKQSDVSSIFVAPVPLYAKRPGSRPVLLGTVVTTGPETPFRFVSHMAPRHILIDPQLTLLCRTD